MKNQANDSMVRIATGIALAAAALLAGCGGGSDQADDEGKLYVGYYQEDPTNNPEDPTPGTLIARLPPESGAFEGQMPFSYVGCMGGADVGTINGTRSTSGLDGDWTGTVDSVAVGGAYRGTYDAGADEFSGTYTNAGGKVHVSGGSDCAHDIAALGTWKLFGGSTNSPSDFVISSSGGTTPTWTWPSQGATVYYLVRVFDHACLNESVTSSQCMMGEGQTLLPRIQYPAEFPSAKPLKDGGSYLVAVHAVNALNARQVGFSTRVDKP